MAPTHRFEQVGVEVNQSGVEGAQHRIVERDRVTWN